MTTRPVHEERIGREAARGRPGIGAGVREIDDVRCRVLRQFEHIVDRAEDGAVVEDAVAAAQHRLAAIVERAAESDARRDVVAVDGMVLRSAEQRVVGLIDRDDLEVVADADAQRRPAAELPFVLRVELDGVVLDELVERAHPDRQPLRIGARIGGVERRVAVDREGAVLVDLRDALELGVVVARADLHFVVALLAGNEPREVVLDLVVRVPRSLRFGAGLAEEALIAQLRRAQHLLAVGLLSEVETGAIRIRALRAEAGIAVPPVLPGPRDAHGIDVRVADHAGQRADRGLIEVGFILRRFRRLPVADRVPLRRPFAQPAHRPAVRLTDLVIDPNQRVPVGAVFRDGKVLVRPRFEHARAVRVVDLALEAAEEVQLVLDDRPANHAAPFALGGGGLREVVAVDEIVLGRQRVGCAVAEQHAPQLVGAGLADGVDDRAAGAAELRVVHAGQDLEFLDRLEWRPHLRAGARAERIVRVVAAVDRDVGVLRGLAVGDDGVVAHLVRRRELHAGQQRHRGEIVAIHRRQLAELGGADVAPDGGAGRVHERRLPGDGDALLDAADD